MKVKGWKNVFKFTYTQTLKSKEFIRSTIAICVIMSLITLGINFIPNFFMGDETETSGTSESSEYRVNMVYILDESTITPAPDFSALEQLGIKTVSISSGLLSETTKKVYDSLNAEILVHITRTENGNYFDILASRPLSEELINADDCNSVLGIISGIISNSNLISLGVSPERLLDANMGVSTHVTVAGEQPKSDIAVLISSILPMLSSIILFIFIFSYCALVAQAIATEKTSRVMELLLTSIKPLAVIIGKILAMGLISLTQLFVLGAVTTGTTLISAPFGLLGKVLGMIQVSDIEMQAISNEIGEAFSSFNVSSIIWLVVIFILGFFFYALIAGLIGATVSRAEDLQAAMQPLSLIAVFGFYLAYMPSIFSINTIDGEKNIISWIALYLPISSPFVLPSSILLGELDLLQTFLAIGVLALFDVLMLLLVAKVYENIVLHTGDRIKIGTILKMAGIKKAN